MKTTIVTVCLSLGLCLCFSQNAEEGFVSLFNGENFEGWKISKDNPGSFSVQNGLLVVKGPRAHIFYDGSVGNADFTNFELKLRAMTMENANSGVYFHTTYQENGWPKVGFEAQVNSTHSDPKKTGSLYGVVNINAPKGSKEPYAVKVGKNREIYAYVPFAPSIDGEWFDYHIIVQGNRIILKINGKVTVDWTQPDDWKKTRRIGHGTIALQAHDPGSEVHYKDIRLKVLD